MTLRVFSFKSKIPKIILLVLLLLIVGCLTRVVIWEHFYYKGKEGSARAESPTIEEEELDEVEPTPEEVKSYNVAPDKPRYISIPKINVVNARVVEIGILSNNQLGAPKNIFDAGWCAKCTDPSKPGQGGTLLMDGHSGGYTKGGVFENLNQLAVGDIIVIERGDGAIFEYEIVDTVIKKIEEAEAYMSKMSVSPQPGVESLSLISCTGDWTRFPDRWGYNSRVMLRATIVASTL